MTHMENAFKILSLDGGGIRGLYQATFLELFERKIQKQHGSDARLCDYVDLVCGTSTGGLVALAVAFGIPMSAVVELYKLQGSKIFPNSNSLYRKFRQLFFRGKYSEKTLKNSLVKMFGDTRIGDSKCLLCIPTFDVTHGCYEIFKYDHTEGNLERHNDLSVVDVCLATSAAPSYFPLASIQGEDDRQFIDGGVWANNPSLVGFLEAFQYFVGQDKMFNRLKMLSISTVSRSLARRPMDARYRSVVSWGSDLFDLGIEGQSVFAHIFLQACQSKCISPIEYLRISKISRTKEHNSILSLDNASPKSLSLLSQYAKDSYYEHNNGEFIRDYFGSLKTYHV